MTRKECSGNRTTQAAETQEILASVVQTARQRDLDLAEILTTLLRTPAVSPLALFARRLQETHPLKEDTGFWSPEGQTANLVGEVANLPGEAQVQLQA